jgi:GT2 family glycosyltransferase
MYGEDLDLNLRIKKLGYRILYWPEVVVHHLKGASTRKKPERMIRAFYEAMAVFHRKHYDPYYPAPFNWLVYTAIELVCQYKLLQARLSPPEKRVVGSTRA